MKLDDLGITKQQSRRWQLLATVPEEDFVEYVGSRNAQHRELTARGVLRLAAQLRNHSLGKRGDAVTRATEIGRIHESNSALIADAQIASLIAELNNHVATLESILQPLFGEESAAAVGAAERRLAARLIREMRQWLLDLESQLACRSWVLYVNVPGKC